jgi:hypothetical protein
MALLVLGCERRNDCAVLAAAMEPTFAEARAKSDAVTPESLRAASAAYKRADADVRQVIASAPQLNRIAQSYPGAATKIAEGFSLLADAIEEKDQDRYDKGVRKLELGGREEMQVLRELSDACEQN